MAKNDERRQRPSAGSRWTTVGERSGIAWDLVKKGCFLGLGFFIVGVIVHGVVRECRYDGITLEPVIVKGPGGEAGPTPEMAAQQIATYIDKIQRTGAREWRPHDLAEGDQTVNIQIPGSSLNVESVVREIASLFPHRQRILRISITANPRGGGYTSAIAVSDSASTMRTTCDAGNKPGALAEMFECLAVEAMKTIDPLFAASYVLSVEQALCANFRPDQVSAGNPVADKKRLLEVLRDYCSFGRTRTLVSVIIDRGRPDDQPWVSYIYGKLHLARADAIAKVDQEAQWYEFDRAISRFQEFPQQNDVLPASALAIQMDAYIKNGLSIHESVRSLKWSEYAAVIKYRLKAAETILDDAAQRLKALADRRQKSVTSGSAQAKAVDGNQVDSMVSHLRGLILYRQWMIEMQKRHWKKPIDFAEGDKEEKQLSDSVSFFEAAYRQGRQTSWLFLDWGNSLRALGKFEEAAKQYRRAGDIAPGDYAPILNVAITLLEKSKINAATATMADHFEAVRHASNYLTWVGAGGPYDNLVDKIADALSVVGDGSEARDFADCRKKFEQYEAPPKQSDLSHTAALKLCVDEARDSLAKRVVSMK